jgi:hypothetical protein
MPPKWWKRANEMGERDDPLQTDAVAVQAPTLYREAGLYSAQSGTS